MRVIRHQVAGEEVRVHFPEAEEDLDGFDRFLAQGDQYLGLDTETSGLDVFTAGHELRLLQVGNATDAWVLRVDRFRGAAIKALEQSRNFVAHNAPYDALVIDRHLGVPVEQLMPKIWDTKILAHIVDPRGKDEGGIGLDLKTLCAVHVDPDAPDTQNDLTAVFNSLGWKKVSGWSRIAIDHHAYVLYAGLDAILVHRLLQVLQGVLSESAELSKFEHKLQYLLTLLQRKGMPLDIPYVQRLLIELHNENVEYCDLAADLGVDNVDSPAQVGSRLIDMGETLTEHTPSGQLKVDRSVLLQLADLDRDWKRIGAREPNPVADAVIRAKRAGKWAKTYAQAFLDHRDPSDRLHPTINSLQARTARMSVSRPPLQQLPSSDWRIRRAFIPDPGHVMIAADYMAVEMRVLAAVSGDLTMQNAIRQGLDLHSFTAERVFGPDFTSKDRKIAKSIGFGKVYGGGADGISRQTGADVESVRHALQAYDQVFPGIRRYSFSLIQRAQRGAREVVTPIGRRLPLDEDRLYAATNYVVQSTSRDLLAKAILNLFEAGFDKYLFLPVHDELIGQAPVGEAMDVVREIGEVMESTFQGVRIASSAAVVGSSWGSGYGAPEQLPAEMPIRKERRERPGQWFQDGLDI